MTAPFFIGVIWFVLFVLLFARLRRRRAQIGSGAAGSVHDMLNEDKRKAVEIVVEGRAEAQDPESRDGNLPDLDHPRAPR